MFVMKKVILLSLISLVMFSCSDPYKHLSPKMAAEAKKAIYSVENRERQKQLEDAISLVKPEYQEGMAFLIAYMRPADLDTLPTRLLISNVNMAYRARETFPWAKALTEDVFFNEVLPYASTDETREDWRASFYEMLSPLVEDATDIYQAIDTVNKALKELVNVEYNTKRNKPNQSPKESMDINMASCTGLSILLTDAFRAVGIPSRIAGTPLWVSKEGNHNWCEVLVDSTWYFTEYYPDALNKSWFLERAGKADKSDSIYWIYATSYKPTTLAFPMVWAEEDKTVPGVDVTDRYIDLYQKQLAENERGTQVVVRMYKTAQCTLDSDGRVATLVTVKTPTGETIASGTTAGPNADMNDYLKLYLPHDNTFIFEYETANGLKTEKVITDGPKDIRLSWE